MHILQVQQLRSVKGIPGQRGRFGLALASPADLNGDSVVDVVVGAPLEDNNQGSIYIFNGRNEDIAPTFSQVSQEQVYSILLWLRLI